MSSVVATGRTMKGRERFTASPRAAASASTVAPSRSRSAPRRRPSPGETPAAIEVSSPSLTPTSPAAVDGLILLHDVDECALGAPLHAAPAPA